MSKNRSSTCPVTGKRRLRDHRQAVKALRKAATARFLTETLGGKARRRERRSYRCEHCLGWHLTSIESWSETGPRTRTEVPSTKPSLRFLRSLADGANTGGRDLGVHPSADLRP